jgi:hypothetical protein
VDRFRPFRYHPHLDELEDRALPNSLFGLMEAFSQHGGQALGDLSLLNQEPVVQHVSTLTGATAGSPSVQVPPLPTPQAASGPSAPPAQAGSAATPSAGPSTSLTQTLSPADAGGGANPGVLPPQSNAFGASYSEWSARWWQYAFSVPTPQSPFLDQTGANFSAGQSGKVWYLSGGLEFTTSQTPPPGNINVLDRTVTMPTGKALFFPVLNTEFDNVTPGGPDTTLTPDQLRSLAQSNMNSAENMTATIDGRAVSNLSQYRVTSPVFGYHLPADNIESFFAGTTIPARDVYPAVGDGVYLMLAPLSAGQHTVHFSGDFGPGNFGLDVTYHITVTPGNN